ncbi:MAG TPA: hypothetical protein VHV31_08105, partial [Nitrolancea sp.]|nr:hypothetical protein [Nitrolancea sp.]
TAIWQYGRTLHAFRTGGPNKRAKKLLTGSLKGNPHVPAYLIGTKRLPRQLPDLIGVGHESEATYCAASQLLAWSSSAGALEWLASQTA